jgi:hypothetical protein
VTWRVSRIRSAAASAAITSPQATVTEKAGRAPCASAMPPTTEEPAP